MRQFRLALSALMAVILFAACQSNAAPAPASPAPETATAASPDGRIQVQVTSLQGQPSYAVAFDGTEVIAPSRLGLRFAAGPDLDTGFAIVSASTTSSDQTWEQPWGERRLVRDQHTELAVTFAATSGPERGYTLRVRLFNDGLGFRYEVPDDGDRAIIDEITEFRVDPDATAWWTPAGAFNRYEYVYRTTPVREMERAHTPFTLRTDEGIHLAIHEAALVDYADMWLDQRRAGVLEADLAPSYDGVRVRVDGAFRTPWRAVQIADSAVGLVNGSDLYLNLNEPNALGDVSYFKPGKYIGIWWGMHINAYTWGSGPRHGATTANTRRYIDFAAEHGFSGVLVEGWNIGWDGDWFNNGDLFSFTEPYPDFDLPALAAYAAERGVQLIGHHETSGNITNYENQLEEAFALYARHGYSVVKTGYVADASDLKFIDKDGFARYTWHAGQERVAHDLHVLKRAHAYGLAINVHEPVKDTGLRRTYPNAVTREGARGMEFNAWGSPPNPPEHEAILPFTRLLAGPFDFTPGIFDLMPNGPEDPNRVSTTLAKQLALYVTIYSPVQMAADLPENYEARPEAFQFIKDVPADWEQSIALQGEVGDFVVMARQRRGGEDWYLGAVSDETARALSVPLDFLEDGRTYRAEIYRDGPGADWDTNPYDLVIETREVTSGTILSLPLATSGGAAVRLVPLDGPGADTAPQRRVELGSLEGPGLLPRDVTVLLPPGYDGARSDGYPVLYMHDGQNLMDPGRAYGGAEWQVDETSARLITEGRMRPAIIVAIGNTAQRWQDYAPAGFIGNLPESRRVRMITEQGGPPRSGAYLDFIVNTLKPRIDRDFHTADGPANTFIMGASMGGLISLQAINDYPGTFGAAAGLSTHWPLSDPQAADVEETVAAVTQALGEGGLDPARHRLWLDHGSENLDAHYGPYQAGIVAFLQSRGFDEASLAGGLYPGADHNEASWAARLEDPLVFLLGTGGQD